MGGVACRDGGSRPICFIDWCGELENARCLLHHDHFSFCANDVLPSGVIQSLWR